jgi:hypothetical protein
MAANHLLMWDGGIREGKVLLQAFSTKTTASFFLLFNCLLGMLARNREDPFTWQPPIKRGRKATGQTNNLMAALPKEGEIIQLLGNEWPTKEMIHEP